MKHFLEYVAAQPVHFSRNYVIKLYNIFRYPRAKTKWIRRYREILLLLGLCGFAVFLYRRQGGTEWVMGPIAAYFAGFGALSHITTDGRINLPLKVLFSFFAAYCRASVKLTPWRH